MSKKEEFVKVAEEGGNTATELPLEDDGTLLLLTLQSQFPGSTGLKYMARECDSIRGIRMNGNRFYPAADGWGDNVYYSVYPKRSSYSNNSGQNVQSKHRRAGRRHKRRVPKSKDFRCKKSPDFIIDRSVEPNKTLKEIVLETIHHLNGPKFLQLVDYIYEMDIFYEDVGIADINSCISTVMKELNKEGYFKRKSHKLIPISTTGLEFQPERESEHEGIWVDQFQLDEKNNNASCSNNLVQEVQLSHRGARTREGYMPKDPRVKSANDFIIDRSIEPDKTLKELLLETVHLMKNPTFLDIKDYMNTSGIFLESINSQTIDLCISKSLKALRREKCLKKDKDKWTPYHVDGSLTKVEIAAIINYK